MRVGAGLVSTSEENRMRTSLGPGFDSRLLHDSGHRAGTDEEDKMGEIIFGKITVQVVIPGEVTDDYLDKLSQMWDELDLNESIEAVVTLALESDVIWGSVPFTVEVSE